MTQQPNLGPVTGSLRSDAALSSTISSPSLSSSGSMNNHAEPTSPRKVIPLSRSLSTSSLDSEQLTSGHPLDEMDSEPRTCAQKTKAFFTGRSHNATHDASKEKQKSFCHRCTELYTGLVDDQDAEKQATLFGRELPGHVVTTARVFGREITFRESKISKAIGQFLAKIAIIPQALNAAGIPGLDIAGGALAVITAFAVRATVYLAEKAIIASLLIALAAIALILFVAIVLLLAGLALGTAVIIGVVLALAYVATMIVDPAINSHNRRKIMESDANNVPFVPTRTPLDFVLDNLLGTPGNPSLLTRILGKAGQAKASLSKGLSNAANSALPKTERSHASRVMESEQPTKRPLFPIKVLLGIDDGQANSENPCTAIEI